MTQKNPFEFVKSINEKKYIYDLSGYTPFLTNRCFAMHIDTVLLADEMNRAHELSPSLQYDFYYYSVRQGTRFGYPPKPQEYEYIDAVSEYFNYSHQKSIEALRHLTQEQLQHIIKSQDKGGNSDK